MRGQGKCDIAIVQIYEGNIYYLYSITYIG
jgi:hypothetical protein